MKTEGDSVWDSPGTDTVVGHPGGARCKATREVRDAQKRRTMTSSSVLTATSMTSWFSPAKPAEGEGGLIEHEKANNKMLRALRENECAAPC